MLCPSLYSQRSDAETSQNTELLQRVDTRTREIYMGKIAHFGVSSTLNTSLRALSIKNRSFKKQL